eukprot:63728-Hanusia_phi.AAC.1
MELCSDSLQKHLQKRRLSLHDRMRLGVEVLQGVTYLHANGIIHRDLSTQNILLNQQGRVKIADFGCARKVSENGEYFSTTISGSPAYMAPEQMHTSPLTTKVDVWAVGVILWELATQKLPWADEALLESPTRVADFDYCKRKIIKCRLPRPSPNGFS